MAAERGFTGMTERGPGGMMTGKEEESMGDIGTDEPLKRRILEPMPATEPVPEIAPEITPEPVIEPARVPEEVPA